jgi:type I restriction enzyme S subunit
MWQGVSGSASKEGIVSPAYTVITPEISIDRTYAKYLVKNPLLIQMFHRNSQGMVNDTLNLKFPNFASISVKVPPFPEQKKIAAILTSVDEVIETTQKQIDKLQDLKKATMNELLTKGIGHTEFKDSELGRIPKSWEVRALDEVAEFVTSGSRGWSQYYAESGALFVRIGNLTRENINFKFEDIVRVNPPENGEGTRTKVAAGDILISITADLGVIAVASERLGEAYVNQHVCLVRLSRKFSINSRWVGHYLSGDIGQDQFIKKNDSGAKAGLNLPTIRSIKFSVPAPNEQELIVGALDQIDAHISKERQKLAQTQALKKSLMQDLLTGKVRVKVD